MLLFLFCAEVFDLNVVIFAGQPVGLTDRLPVGSGYDNLDRFHLWHITTSPTSELENEEAFSCRLIPTNVCTKSI